MHKNDILYNFYLLDSKKIILTVHPIKWHAYITYGVEKSGLRYIHFIVTNKCKDTYST